MYIPSLRDLCALKISIIFWSREDQSEYVLSEEWDDMRNEYIEKIASLNKNWSEVESAIVTEGIDSLGVKVTNFFSFLREKMNYDLDLIKDSPQFLFWNDDGTIDEATLFDCHMSEEDYYHDKYNNYALCYMACSNAVVDFVKRCSHYFKHYTRGSSHKLIRETVDYTRLNKKSNKENIKKASKELLLICAQEGCSGAKFYWKKMGKSEQISLKLSPAVRCIKKFKTVKNAKTKDYLREKYVDLLYFFLTKMSVNERKKFFKLHSCDVLIMFASFYPWNIYFAFLLEETKNHLTRNDCAKILVVISELMVQDDALLPFIRLTTLYKNFSLISNLSVEKDFEESDRVNIVDQYREVLRSLYKLKLFGSLKVIINDKKFEAEKEKFLDIGKKEFLDLANDSKKLNDFVDSVFLSKEGKSFFAAKIKGWEQIEKLLKV